MACRSVLSQLAHADWCMSYFERAICGKKRRTEIGPGKSARGKMVPSSGPSTTSHIARAPVLFVLIVFNTLRDRTGAVLLSTEHGQACHSCLMARPLLAARTATGWGRSHRATQDPGRAQTEGATNPHAEQRERQAQPRAPSGRPEPRRPRSSVYSPNGIQARTYE